MPISSRDYRKRDDYSRVFGVGGSTLVRAMTSAAHAAGATQVVNLTSATWVEGTATVDAENPSGVSIPDGTKLLIAQIGTKWVIVQAYICTE